MKHIYATFRLLPFAAARRSGRRGDSGDEKYK